MTSHNFRCDCPECQQKCSICKTLLKDGWFCEWCWMTQGNGRGWN